MPSKLPSYAELIVKDSVSRVKETSVEAKYCKISLEAEWTTINALSIKCYEIRVYDHILNHFSLLQSKRKNEEEKRMTSKKRFKHFM